MADITCKTFGLDEVTRFMLNVPKACEKAERMCLYDLRRRVPTTVSSVVSSVYNISKSDVKPVRSLLGDGKQMPRLYLRVSGNSLATLRFVYAGRLLTPVHFDMSPESAGMNPKQGYTLKMRVFRGGGDKRFGQHVGKPRIWAIRDKQGSVHFRAQSTGRNPYYPKSGNMLFPTGTKKDYKISHIPMQRVSSDRKDIKKFTVLSVPQMISGKHCRDIIQDRINSLTGKRIEHSLSRVMGL